MRRPSTYILVTAFLLFPLVMTNAYYMHLTYLILIYAIAASGLNVVTGYAGQLSLGHAAFFALGAYSSALLTLELHWSFPAAVLASAAVASMFGGLLGLPSLRLRGPYLALVTAGFGEIIRITINNWEDLTQGSRGIQSIPPPSLFGSTLSSPLARYYLLAFVLLISIGAIYRLRYSHLGRAWIAIRDNEPAAGSAGINTLAYKVLAFAVSAFFSGMAGSLYAHYLGYISPDTFTFAESVLFLSMVVVGGKGTVWGPIIGAAALTLVPDFLSFLEGFKMVFHGLLLVAAMMFLPGGLASLAGTLKWWPRFRPQRGGDSIGASGG